jgi:hypothetical protein
MLQEAPSLIQFENIVLSMRKIVESISYCCLLTAEIRAGQVPRQIRNSWNADDIFGFLRRRKLLHLPDFARLKLAKAGKPNVWKLKITASKNEEVDKLIAVYRQCNRFLHEFNPYLPSPLRQEDYAEGIRKSYDNLGKDHMWIWNRFWQHSVHLQGKLLVVNFGDERPETCPQIVRSEGVLAEHPANFVPIDWTRVIVN